MGHIKLSLIKLLKRVHLYTPIKRIRDNFMIILRDRFSFNGQMIGLYSQLVKKGDICFDIGSAYGNRISIFLKLGARKVVAVEPLSYYFKKLNKCYGNNPKVILERAGVSDKTGVSELNVSSSPFLSTFDQEVIEDIKSNPQMANVEWIGKEKVPLKTLDSLIKKHGVPDFIKIDIEGFEYRAIKGLSYPINKLSFEYQTRFKQRAIECIRMLSKIGKYRFNYSVMESMKFSSPKWFTAEEMIKHLELIPEKTYFGDIYACLQG